MSAESFTASVQYDDYKGSSAADRADHGDAQDWLQSQGLISQGEFLAGIKVYVGSLNNNPDDEIVASVNFFVSPASGFDKFSSSAKTDGPVQMRRISREMSLREFFRLFKRLEISLSSKGELEGREVCWD